MKRLNLGSIFLKIPTTTTLSRRTLSREIHHNDSIKKRGMLATLTLVFTFLVLLCVPAVQAEVIVDGTVGSAGYQSLTGPDYAIGESLGERQGDNLFHSFEAFSLNAGESATFTGDPAIQNIICRVTGGNVSNIDGAFNSAINGAHVYFMNPAGVIFDPNASINLSGEAYPSTADYLDFTNDDRFYADPLESSVLSVAAPVAFGFLGAPGGNISVNGSQLTGGADQALSLMGGDILIHNSARLSVASGQVNLIGVASAGEIDFSGSDPVMSGFFTLGDISINSSTVDVSGNGGGRVFVRGGSLVMEDVSVDAWTTGAEDGAGVDISVSGEFSFTRSLIDTGTEGQGHGGDIILAANSMILDASGASGDVGFLADSLSYLMADFRLSLDIEHQSDGDLIARLVSPLGTGILLFSHVGGTGEDFTATILDDAGTQSITDGVAPFTGTFRPEEAFTDLIGEDANGDWQLEIEDDAAFLEGILNAWSIEVGTSSFDSGDVPVAINDNATVSSTLSVSDPGLTVEGIVPGDAGDITLNVTSISVNGDVVLSSTIVDTASMGSISTTASSITIEPYGLEGDLFVVNGVGRFDVVSGSIIFDGTLGPAETVSGPNYEILQAKGSTSGTNLFHSFSDFMVARGETVNFEHTGMTHIIVRVTGGELSRIDGAICSNGADLYFINPSGVILGQNSTLDTSGSFSVSTADYLDFSVGDTDRFLADNTQSDVFSTAPVAFGFLDGSVSSIEVEGSGLSMTGVDQTLSLIGGAISVLPSPFDGAGAELTAESGQMNLIGVASAGEVDVSGTDPVVSNGTLADIMIDSSALDVSGQGGGRVFIRGGNLTMEDGSIATRTAGAVNGEGVDIVVSNTFSFTRSEIDTSTTGEGNAGDILVAAASMAFDASNVSGEVGLFADSLGFSLSDFFLSLDIWHEYDYQLTAWLESPSGTSVLLFSGLGGEGDHYSGTVFNSAAAVPITSGSPPFAGTYRPQDSFDAFVGEEIGGTWTLRVRDDENKGYIWPVDWTDDDGDLNGWSITIPGNAFTNSSSVYIGDETTVSSTISINEIDLNNLHFVSGTPGTAGNITLETPLIRVKDGNPLLSSKAVDPASFGVITTVPAAPPDILITIDGYAGEVALDIDDENVGRFEMVLGTVVLDGSLGKALSIVGPNYTISDKWGTQSGTNLFFSFSDFVVIEGEVATFEHSGADRIICRITGGSESRIDGEIAAGGADIFFVNAAGLVLGPTAILDTNGSFHVSTADYLDFSAGDTDRFYTSLIGNSVFSGAPVAFGFSGASAGDIEADDAYLIRGTDDTISLIGGTINIYNGTQITAESGHVHVIGTASAGEVDVSGAAPVMQGFSAFADVLITNSAIDVHGDGGGQVFIRGKDMIIEDSFIAARTTGGVDGEDVNIGAEGSLDFIHSLIDTSTEAQGDAGHMVLAANSTSLDLSNVSSEGFFADSLADPAFDFRLTLDINHSFNSDLTARLMSPSGTVVVLFFRVGGSSADFMNTIFDDNATKVIRQGTGPFSDAFQPQEAFGTLLGEEVSGTWTLEIDDAAETNEGSLVSWEITIDGQAFSSSGGPVAIPDIGTVSSTIFINEPGLSLGVDAGKAGEIHFQTGSVAVQGEPLLAAAAKDEALIGETIDARNPATSIAPPITVNGATGLLFFDKKTGEAAFHTSLGTVILDGSLGPARTVTGPEYEISEAWGTTSGGNLFHSFSDFQVTKGERVIFEHSAGIERIIVRVTGSSAVSIDGTLLLSGADLYFMRSADVILSPNANLDVDESFYLSTADYLAFGPGDRFVADGADNNVFSVTPAAFGFVNAPAAGIRVEGAYLSTGQADKTLSFIGGAIQINAFDGQEARLTAEPGTINVVSVASAGEVDVSGADYDVSSFSTLGSVAIERSSVNTSTLFVGAATVAANGASGLTIAGTGTFHTGGTCSGRIAGAGTLTKEGEGVLTLSHVSNTYAGATTVEVGTLNVTGTLTDSVVTVNNGATLQGTGTIIGTVSVDPGATLAPGESPGILATGDLALNAGTTLFLELDGTIVGDDYDQVDVTGAVDLGDATLDVALGFTPSPRQTFTILNNDGANPVVNTFNGLDEGALFNSRGSRFRITYRGGDGNDVVLTFFPPYIPYMLLLDDPEPIRPSRR
ncbi:MAG: filamentous hemagglutinin N-terminal domain-containing protein [Thermodesulfobacteriota bacterium]|nr:filamentous hemagglutinin N-terminal domain-containing protein [Thermodesulfobacteriota bacterium]